MWYDTGNHVPGSGRTHKILQYQLYYVPTLSRNDIDWNSDSFT